jgi:hypothetical protein
MLPEAFVWPMNPATLEVSYKFARALHGIFLNQFKSLVQDHASG